MQLLLQALALMLVLEGLGPFLSPRNARAGFLRLAALDDRWLRIMGLVLMATGCAFLALVSPA